MPKLTRRRLILLAFGTFVVLCTPFLLDRYAFDPGPLTPELARSALAAEGWCELDAPISERNGKLFIGEYQCNLGEGTWFLDLGRIHFQGRLQTWKSGRFERRWFRDWKAIETMAMMTPSFKLT